MNVREGFIDAEPVQQEQPAPAAPATEPYVETWPIKVKLIHKAIRDGKNNEVKELVFREPTAGDINRYGNPVRLDTNSSGMLVQIIDEQKMTLIMAALTGILSPLLDRMDPRDWNSCAYRLRPFFLPNPDSWA